MSRPTSLPTHEELIRLTRDLRRRLKRLIAKFPEDAVDPDRRIFPRLLTHSWRHLHSGAYGPHDQKYAAAVHWCDDYYGYLEKLRYYCSFVSLKPELFKSLPVNESRKPAAEDCLHLFDLQVEALGNLKKATAGHQKPADGRDESELRRRLQEVVDTQGLKAVAHELKCNADTLRDLLGGVTKPRRSTLENARVYLRDKHLIS